MRWFLSILLLLVFACDRSKESLPQNILDLKLVQRIEGDDALRRVNELHFNPVTDEENIIAEYQGPSGNATIYLTYYDFPREAMENFKRMTEKISPQNSVFIMGSFYTIDNVNIYRCFGMGQTHFVFAHGKILYWISVETLIGQQFLEEWLASLSQPLEAG